MKDGFGRQIALFVVVGLVLALLPGCDPGQNVAGPGDDIADTILDVPRDLVEDVLGEITTDVPIDLPGELPPYCPEEYEPCTFCKEDADCDDVFPDLTVCEAAVCDEEMGYCKIQFRDAGTPCGDGDICNGEENCQLDGEVMACAAGVPLECDDGEPCDGLESCDPVAGCQDGEALVCDDGDACNGLEACEEGTGCIDGEPLECDDGEFCTGEESCDPETGCTEGEAPLCDDGDACNGIEGCDNELGCTLGKELKCDDHNVCNGLETCDSVEGCVDDDDLDCDDANDCTDDSCVVDSGCVHVPNTNPGCCEVDADCDDSNVCTTDVCNGGTKACEYVAAQGPCSDGDPCTDGDQCNGSICEPGGLLLNCMVVCELGGDVGDTITCDTGLARRFQDEGAAAALKFKLRYDGGMATLLTLVDQVCLGEGGCTNINIPEGGVSLFESGHTVYLTPELPAAWAGTIELSLQNATDAAVPISDAYYDDNEMLVGDAHLLAFQFEVADGFPEGQKLPVVIYDVEAVSATGSDLAIATVKGTIVTSEDGCGGSLKHCFDARQCTADVCNEAQGTCSFDIQEGPCDDGNVCTLNDFCDEVGDCVPLSPAPADTDCAGENLCAEVGKCDGGGKCVFDDALAVDCPDAPSDCAEYECNPKSGNCTIAAFAPGVQCSDDDACTTDDACNGLGDCVGDLTDCDDGFACTLDSCTPGTGVCFNDPDGNLCDDGNPCTVDMCNTELGCASDPLSGAACNDDNPCTLDDECLAGECVGDWNAAECGCAINEDCVGLDDGNPCTGTWYCSNDECVINPSTVVKCPEYAGDCQIWTCNPQSGECVAADAEDAFECDGGACMLDAACDAGACTGEAVDCDDGDECTEDICDPVTGCEHVLDPGCLSKYCICEVSGTEGDEVTCPMLLVRDNDQVKAPVGADFELQWDPGAVALANFADEVCMGPICMPKVIPTCAGEGTGCVWGSIYPTGHNIVAVPKELVAWEDHGTLLLFHPSDSFKIVSQAYFDGAAIVGDDALFMAAKLTLEKDIPAEDPVCLWMADPHFSLPSGLSLDIKVEDTDAGRAIVVY